MRQWLKVVWALVGSLVVVTALVRSVQAGTFVDAGLKRLESALMKRVDFDAVLEKVSRVKNAAEWLPRAGLGDDERLYLAIRWTQQNYLSEAGVALEKIDDTLTDTDLLRFYRATVNLALGRMDESQADFDALTAKHPDDPAVVMLHSNLLAQQQDFNGALAVLDRVFKKDSRNGKAYFQRGLLNMLLLLHDQAYEDFIKAAKFLPKSDTAYRQQAYFQAGLVRLRLHGDVKGAEGLFKKGIALDPESELVAELHRTIK